MITTAEHTAHLKDLSILCVQAEREMYPMRIICVDSPGGWCVPSLVNDCPRCRYSFEKNEAGTRGKMKVQAIGSYESSLSCTFRLLAHPLQVCVAGSQSGSTPTSLPWLRYMPRCLWLPVRCSLEEIFPYHRRGLYENSQVMKR